MSAGCEARQACLFKPCSETGRSPKATAYADRVRCQMSQRILKRGISILLALFTFSAITLETQASQVTISWSWKKQNQISVWTPAAGKTFIVVTATISVQGYSDFNTNPFNFKLDADSSSYTHHTATYALSDHFSHEVIPDGSSRAGTLVFEIPVTAAVVGLRYQSFSQYNIRYMQRGRCIIATAAYGSEMAAPVQALREIRDNQVLTTFAGAQFMRVFDRFYYSFSPTIADAIALNPAFADAARIVLTPFIQILGLFRVTGVSEIGVILGGLASTTLIGVVYLMLPLFLMRRLRLIERLGRPWKCPKMLGSLKIAGAK